MKRPVVIGLLVTALVLLLAGIGAVLFFTLRSGFPSDIAFTGNVTSKIEESKTLKVDIDEPVLLNIVDDVGSVSITGADVKTVQIDVVKTSYDTTQEKADEKVKNIKYSIEQTGNTISITYEVPNLNNFRNYNSVDFVITVPNETIVDIDNNIGDVKISEIQGNASVQLDFGNTNVANITGALSVNSNGGDINASAIKANSEEITLHSDFGNIHLEQSKAKDISITSNGGDIMLSEVIATGKIETKTDFGETTYKNGSANAVKVQTNGGDVTLEKIKITNDVYIKDDFGEIELMQVIAQTYEIESNGGNITVDGAKGILQAHTDFGKIIVKNAVNTILDLKTNSGDIEFSGSLGEGDHHLKTDFGNITLTIPSDTKLNVDLSTDFGNIETDIPVTVTTTGQVKENQFTGQINGGGAQLTAETNSGNIKINVNE